jgi:hypothetical protein
VQDFADDTKFDGLAQGILEFSICAALNAHFSLSVVFKIGVDYRDMHLA